MLYKSGEQVGKGTYWEITHGERFDVTGIDLLPYVNKTWVKMPVYLMLAIGPVLGLLFAVFLPAIGILMAIKFLCDKSFDYIRTLSIHAYSMSWRPIEAYLTGKKKNKKARH